MRSLGFYVILAPMKTTGKSNVSQITLICAVLALFCGCCFVGSAPVKHMCYNVRHCVGIDGKLDVARIASIIKAEKPDYVGLQEIDRCTERVHGMDQPEELARLTGMHSTFAKAIPYKGGEYGVMLLSRSKPLSVEKVPLPGQEPRVLLMCEFEDCVVCTTHLAVDSQKARSNSVAIIRKAIERFSSGKDKPVFISGDWNSLPDSDVLKELEKFLTVISDIGGRTFHGSSGAGPRDLNGKRPESYCIDYIAVDSAHASQFKPSDARVVEERKASDHAPIVVTVTRSK